MKFMDIKYAIKFGSPFALVNTFKLKTKYLKFVFVLFVIYCIGIKLDVNFRLDQFCRKDTLKVI